MKRSLLWRVYGRRKGGLALALFLSLLTLAAGVALLGVSGWFLTGAALAGAGAMFNLFVPSSLVRGLSFIRICSRYAERLAGHATTLRLLADLRGTVFNALVRLTPRQLARYRAGDLVARLTGDVDALDTVFLFVLAPVATAVLGGAILCTVLGYWIPAAGLALGAALLVACLLVPWALARAARRAGSQAQTEAAALRSAVIDAVEGHGDITAHNAQARVCAQFDTACAGLAQARGVQARVAARGLWLVQACAGLAMVAVLWFGIPAVAAGTLSGPLMAGLVLATLGVFEIAGPIMRGAARLGGARAAAGRIAAIVEREPDLRDPLEPQALPESGLLVARDVAFAYPAREGDTQQARLLHDVSLTIEPGARVAIAGPSGSGKSTLLALLLRMEDPQRGSITYGGVALRDCAQADVHRRIALLSQDAPVFIGTLRTNLLIGAPDASDERLMAMLDRARLGDFVRGLPQGLDTWVGEGGAGLSVGQARRLCLARALLSPAQVLLLDEPTAGLDGPTEAAFLADLARATEGRTVVLATHAALPAGAVDRVYRMQAGAPRLAVDSALA
ncbi:thiol reductant ABC exporter subunit CydC [Bordetella genomosp. 1]|uniref:Thiol reductant ABC exporter subunit CydC n=1 Tax=Bordetella genomosp. 1 TaxID=1395607 RepID=A0A261STE3_9BORD|nr:thiol reductant ABC exporter subunit CydC [Bordetella genomosp. 1]MDQ8032339.1 thiol reductant ABC exporter subunit CydC [Bordetella sp.]OZI40654.1 thiol reductant ABC exporter subunit CydC [Bordetella genomosp. 1]